jgi:predicted membrane protein
MHGPLTRSTLRLGHLIEAALLMAYVYTPLGDWDPARFSARVVVLPAIIATGLLMWKLPALRARARRRAAAAHA